MENLNHYKEIINLGEKLILELELDSETNTLSRWMTHYIAEKINSAKNEPDESRRETLEKECYETILKLWNHRWAFPSKHSPFKGFEEVMETLNALNPDNHPPFFRRDLLVRINGIESEEPELTEVEELIKHLNQVDRLARISIEFLIEQVGKKITNPSLIEILNHLPSDLEETDIHIIRRVIDANEENFDVEYRKQVLNKRIKEMREYMKLNEDILNEYTTELEHINTL